MAINEDGNSWFDTKREFLVATASYFGVPVPQLMRGSTLVHDDTAFQVSLVVALTPEDLMGIASRMKTMREQVQMSAPVQQSEGAVGRKVAHIDVPEKEDPTMMDAIWLPLGECTEAQKQFAVDWSNIGDEDGPQLLIQRAMLTEEQRQKAKEAKP